MTSLALSALGAANLPALVHQFDERTRMCFLRFFTVNVRNPNTRRAKLIIGWRRGRICDRQKPRFGAPALN
jgi:hypothetical protein